MNFKFYLMNLEIVEKNIIENWIKVTIFIVPENNFIFV